MFSWLKKWLEKRKIQWARADDKEFDSILDLVKNGDNVFVTGGAGVGKSYTLSRLKEIYKEKLYITSTTGISAINVGGQTLHSWAGIGIGDKPVEDVIKRIKKKPSLHKMLICCDMLAIDEISMLDSETFDYVNDVLKHVRESDRPFGGIQVLVFGDFFQLPPVPKKGKKNDEAFCFESHTWKELNLKTVILKEIKRQSEKKLSEALNAVRVGKTAGDLKIFYERNIKYGYEPSKDVLQIFGTNADADDYNTKCFNEIEKEPFTYESKDELYCYDDAGKCTVINTKDIQESTVNQSDLTALKRFNEDCKAPQKLELKEGCRVMLLKNLDVKKGLANGSCGTVKQLTSDSICVLFDNGIKMSLNSAEFECAKEGRTKIRRTQYPLRLAYGITIHKAQGMTFDRLVVNFEHIFNYGQAYVALSRTRSLEGLTIKGFDCNKIVASKKVADFYENLEQGREENEF